MSVEITRTSQSHPELVSGSGRGRGKVKARGEMLKRVQHDRLFGLLYRRTYFSYYWCPIKLYLQFIDQRICCQVIKKLSYRLDGTKKNDIFVTIIHFKNKKHEKEYFFSFSGNCFIVLFMQYRRFVQATQQ